MSALSRTKEVIMKELMDGKEHDSNSLREKLYAQGLNVDKQNSSFRTAIYQLKCTGINIISRERGIYQLVKENESNELLQGFSTLMPCSQKSKYYVYVHNDGKIVLNGKLNNNISRQIEICVSDDYKKIALIPEGKNYHIFTKSGHTINAEFLANIKKRRFTLPVTYEMSKKENENIWIGKIIEPHIKRDK